MTALVISVLIASLLGSLHCAGMCGAFLAIAVNGMPGAAQPSRWKVQSAYHGGRLVTYVMLGAATAAIGAVANLGATLAGIQPIATAFAGAVMIWFGASILLKLNGVRVPRMPLPNALRRWVMTGSAAAMNRPPVLRAGMIGLLTTLLPCGWLYAFAVVAGGTARPLMGALVMAVFWLGTLPVMVALGTGLQHGLGALGRRLPVLTSLAVIAVGIYTLAGRSMRDARMFAAVASEAAPIHVDASGAEAARVDIVPTTQRAKLPCCIEAEAEAAR